MELSHHHADGLIAPSCVEDWKPDDSGIPAPLKRLEFCNQFPRLHTSICRSVRKFLKPELFHPLEDQIYIFHGGA